MSCGSTASNYLEKFVSSDVVSGAFFIKPNEHLVKYYLKYIAKPTNSKRVIVMKKNIQLDYNQHYESVLATKDDLQKVKASDFLHYYSDLIIKYSHEIEMKLKSESEESI